MTATEPAPDVRPGPLELVASAEPAVVFGSLAARCAPGLCDGVGIDLVDGQPDGSGENTDTARYHVCSPRDPAQHGSAAHAHDVPFDAPCTDAFHGTATFTWHRPPTDTERALMDVLVQHAVHTVCWQRREQDAHAAARDAEQLQVALRSSREIGAAVGILMTVHQLTESTAFELLRQISQHLNRKVRDLAADIVATGWLDPAALRRAPAAAAAAGLRPDRPTRTNAPARVRGRGARPPW